MTPVDDKLGTYDCCKQCVMDMTRRACTTGALALLAPSVGWNPACASEADSRQEAQQQFNNRNGNGGSSSNRDSSSQGAGTSGSAPSSRPDSSTNQDTQAAPGKDVSKPGQLNLSDEDAKALLDAEEEKRKQRRRQKKGRIRELEEVRGPTF